MSETEKPFDASRETMQAKLRELGIRGGIVAMTTSLLVQLYEQSPANVREFIFAMQIVHHGFTASEGEEFAADARKIVELALEGHVAVSAEKTRRAGS